MAEEQGGKSKTPIIVGGICGCLLIVVVLVVVGGLWVASNAEEIGASIAYEICEAVVDEMPLEQEEKTGIMTEVARLKDGVHEGTIGFAELEKFGEELAGGPVPQLAMAMGADRMLLQPSTLSNEEKADGRLQLERVMRGVYDKSIHNDRMEEVIQPILIDKGNGNYQLDDDPSEEDLRALIANAKRVADEHEISNERFEVDLVAEVRAAVDAVLPE